MLASHIHLDAQQGATGIYRASNGGRIWAAIGASRDAGKTAEERVLAKEPFELDRRPLAGLYWNDLRRRLMSTQVTLTSPARMAFCHQPSPVVA